MFKFLDDAPLECGKPAPPVLVSCMEFSHVMYETVIVIMMTMKILLITMIMDNATGTNLPVSGCQPTTS